MLQGAGATAEPFSMFWLPLTDANARSLAPVVTSFPEGGLIDAELEPLATPQGVVSEWRVA